MPAHNLTCGHCGKAFEGKRSDAVYCGNACRQAAYKSKNRRPRGARPKSSSSFIELHMSENELERAIQKVNQEFFMTKDDPPRQKRMSREHFMMFLAIELRPFLSGHSRITLGELAEALGREVTLSTRAYDLLDDVRKVVKDRDRSQEDAEFWRSHAAMIRESADQWRDLCNDLLKRAETSAKGGAALTVDEVIELREMSEMQFAAYVKIREAGKEESFARRWTRETVGAVASLGNG